METNHAFYDNARPSHPIVLHPDTRYVVVRTEVVRETVNAGQGFYVTTIKHYVERVRK